MAISVQHRFVGTGKKTRSRFTVYVTMDGRYLEAKTFSTDAKAREWARGVEKAFEEGKWAPKDAKHDWTLKQCLEEWRPLRIAEAKGGGRKEGYLVDQWAADPLASRRLRSLTTQDFAQWRDARMKEGASASTIRNRLNFISPLFEKARSDWGIPVPYPNPIRGIRKPPIRAKDRRKRRLKPGEYEALLSAADACGWPLMRPMIVLAVELAWRQGEIAHLKSEHVNLKRRVLFLPPEDVKTEEVRVTPLSDVAYDVLMALETDKEFVFSELSDGVEVCPSTDRITYYFDRCRTAANEADSRLCKDIRFHDLRHEAVSRLFEHGFMGVRLDSMQIAKHFSGHKTLAQLAGYTHFPDADQIWASAHALQGQKDKGSSES